MSVAFHLHLPFASGAGSQATLDLPCFCVCDQPTPTRGLDRLANQPVSEMSLDPVQDRSARRDHGDTFVQADIGGLQVAVTQAVDTRRCAGHAVVGRQGDVDAHGVDV